MALRAKGVVAAPGHKPRSTRTHRVVPSAGRGRRRPKTVSQVPTVTVSPTGHVTATGPNAAKRVARTHRAIRNVHFVESTLGAPDPQSALYGAYYRGQRPDYPALKKAYGEPFARAVEDAYVRHLAKHENLGEPEDITHGIEAATVLAGIPGVLRGLGEVGAKTIAKEGAQAIVKSAAETAASTGEKKGLAAAGKLIERAAGKGPISRSFGRAGARAADSRAGQAIAKQVERLPQPVRQGARVAGRAAALPVRKPLTAPFAAQAPVAAFHGDPGELGKAVQGSGVYASALNAIGDHIAGVVPGVAGNALKDAIDLPATVLPSLYLVGTNPKKALSSYEETGLLPKLARGQFGSALKTAEAHPVYSGLELSGAASVLGRGSGALARNLTGGRLAGTERPPVHIQGLEHVGNVNEILGRGRYSPDLIRQLAQRVYDKRIRGEHATDRQAARILRKDVPDRYAYAREQIRRVGRQEITKAMHEARPKKGRFRTDRASAGVVSLAVQGIIRSPGTFVEDLKHYRKQLVDEAAKKDPKTGKPLLSRYERFANKKLVGQIDKAIEHGNPEEVVRAANAFIHEHAKLTKELVDRGLLDAQQARKAAAIPFARVHLGAQYGKPEQLIADLQNLRDNGNGVKVVERKSQVPVAENGVFADRTPFVYNKKTRTIEIGERGSSHGDTFGAKHENGNGDVIQGEIQVVDGKPYLKYPDSSETPEVLAALRKSTGEDIQTPALARYDPTPAGISEREWFHGSGRKDLTPQKLDASGTQPDSLFGQGVYLTSDSGIARSYAKLRKGGGEPTTYSVRVNPKRVLDLESAPDHKFVAQLQATADQIGHLGDGDHYIHDAIIRALSAGGATNGSVYRAFARATSEFAADYSLSKNDLYEYFQGLGADLRAAGWDALTHKGGVRGGRTHQVLIVLDPADIAQAGHSNPIQRFEAQAAPKTNGRNDAQLEAIAAAIRDASKEQVLGRNGEPLSLKDIEAEMKRHGVGEVGFLTHRPPTPSRGGAFFRSFFPDRQKLATGKRTGQATARGTFDASYRALAEQAIRSRAIVDAVHGFDEFLKKYGVKAPARVKTLGDAHDALRNPEHYDWNLPAELQKEGSRELVPLRTAPFNALKREIDAAERHQQVMDPANAAELEGVAHKALTQAAEGGSGPIAFVPKATYDRLLQHFAPSGGVDKGAQFVNSVFKGAVLPFSPSFYVGNLVDNALRAALSGIGPTDILLGRQLVKGKRFGKQVAEPLSPAATESLTPGALYSSFKRINPYRDARQFKGTAAEPIARTFNALHETHGPKEAVAAFTATRNFLLEVNSRLFERLAQFGAVGKEARRELQATTGHWHHALTISNSAFADLSKGLRNTDKQIQYAKAVEQTFGNWGKNGPAARSAMANLVPFWQWARAATRFVWATLPAHHPIKTALIAAAAEMTEKERKQFGLDIFAKEPLPGFLQGNIPRQGGVTRNLSKYSSFGVFGDYPEFISRLFFAQGNTPQKALEGLDWKGDKLTKADGTPAGPLERAWAATLTAGESFLPGFNLLQAVAEGDVSKFNPLAVEKGEKLDFLRGLSTSQQITVPAKKSSSSGSSTADEYKSYLEGGTESTADEYANYLKGE